MKTLQINKTNFKRKTLAKSNECLLDGINSKSYGFYIDYLVLNLQGVPNLSDTKNYSFDFADYGTRNHNKVVSISSKTEKLAVLTFDARNDYVKISDWCVIKFENHLFYTKTATQLKLLTYELLQVLNLKVYSIFRLDLALDFINSKNKVENLYKKIVNGSVLIGGRPKDLNTFKFFQKTDKGQLTLEGFQLGSRSSDRFCRIYNKSLEMQKVNKSYISQTWQKMNLKGSNIWRFEYQLNSNYLRNLKDFQFDDLFNMDKLFSLFVKAKESHFKLHQKIRGRELNKMPILQFFNMEQISKVKKVVVKSIERLKRVIKETLIGQKRLVKALLRSYFSSSQRLEYLLAMRTTLEQFNLENWFRYKHQYYIKEFQNIIITKGFNQDLYNEHFNISI